MLEAVTCAVMQAKENDVVLECDSMRLLGVYQRRSRSRHGGASAEVLHDGVTVANTDILGGGRKVQILPLM